MALDERTAGETSPVPPPPPGLGMPLGRLGAPPPPPLPGMSADGMRPPAPPPLPTAAPSLSAATPPPLPTAAPSLSAATPPPLPTAAPSLSAATPLPPLPTAEEPAPAATPMPLPPVVASSHITPSAPPPQVAPPFTGPPLPASAPSSLSASAPMVLPSSAPAPTTSGRSSFVSASGSTTRVSRVPSVPVLFDDEPQNFGDEEQLETPDANYPEVMLEPLHTLDRLCLKWHLTGLAAPSSSAPAQEEPAPVAPAPPPSTPAPAAQPPSTPQRAYAQPPYAAAPPPSSRPAGGYLRLLGLLSTGRPWECSLPLVNMQRAGGMALGRDPSCCEVLLQEASISRRHAIFEYINGYVVVTDQNSTNGTFLNGRQISSYEGRVPLQDGYILTVGDISLRVEIFAANGNYR